MLHISEQILSISFGVDGNGTDIAVNKAAAQMKITLDFFIILAYNTSGGRASVSARSNGLLLAFINYN